MRCSFVDPSESPSGCYQYAGTVTLPSIELRPNADPDGAIALLKELAVNCHGYAQPGRANTPAERRDAYVQWATLTEGRLRTILSTLDAAVFFDGPRHRDICSMTPGSQLLPMISAEIQTLSDRFGTLACELDSARKLFKGPSKWVIPDTSFYIEDSDKIEDVDFHPLANTVGPVAVLIPMVIVDELDQLKRSSSRDARWRAGYSLAVIDRVVRDPPLPGILHPEAYMPPRGQVTLQIVFDPPGHRRLPINDDEIVDRCLACLPFTRDLMIITYDTGQSTRARAAGLDVKKLSRELGPEP